MAEADTKLTVYYDGDCPVCRREIGVYQARDARGAVEWVNICAVPAEALGSDLNADAAMARFHVRTPDGRLVAGAGAFALMWQQIPGFRAWGHIAAFGPVRFVLDRVYSAYLVIRPAIRTRPWGRVNERPRP